MTARDHSMLESLLEKLGLLKPEEEGERPLERSPGGGAVEDRTKDVVAFERQIESVLGRHGSELHNNVYLVGLEKLKDRLGDRWEKAQDKVHASTKSIIESHISKHDVHLRYDDQSYLIVFTELGAREAQLKCAAICEEILETLMGREKVSDLLEIKQVSTEENKMQFKDLPPVRELINRAVEDLQMVTKETPSDGRNQKAMLPSKRTEKTQDVDFIFRPILAIRNKIVSTFLCIPTQPVSGGFLSGYEMLGDNPSPPQIFELDELVLDTTAAEFSKLLNHGGRSLVGIPVHFETLANHNARTKYISKCEAAFSERHDRIIFEINGLPDGVPQARLHDLVTRLRPEARDVLARFALDHTGFPAFKTAGLHAVGFDIFSTYEKEERIMKKMDLFLKSARKNSLKTYILGIRSVSLYTAALTDGFDYLSGYALTPVAKTAEDIYSFKLDMPYLSMLENAR